MTLSLFQDAREIWEAGEVSFDFSTCGTLNFLVESQSSDRSYDVSFDLSKNRLQCGCPHGVTEGVNGALCKHKVAVICFLTERHRAVEEMI